MQYQIVSRRSGYLRLRFGKYVFTKEQGYGLATLLSATQGVEQVQTNPTNGSVQITCTGALEQDLLQTLSALRQADLMDGIATKEQEKLDVSREFQEN